MAPELITSGDYTAAIDVFAYAVLVYELFCQIRPWIGLSAAEIFKRVASRGDRSPFFLEPPQPLEDLQQRQQVSNFA
jgi:hypothetical protein